MIRHNHQTKSNILFMDYHAEPVDGSSLAPSFDLPTLSQQQWHWPRWRFDMP